MSYFSDMFVLGTFACIEFSCFYTNLREFEDLLHLLTFIFEEQRSEKFKLKHIFGQQQGTESASNLMFRMAEGQSCVHHGFQISTVASQS